MGERAARMSPRKLRLDSDAGADALATAGALAAAGPAVDLGLPPGAADAFDFAMKR